MTLQEQARQFAAAVKQTGEFAALKQAQADIRKNPGLKTRVQDFEKMRAALYSTPPGKEAEDKAARLQQQFSTLAKAPEVVRYFEAGKRFNEMMAKVYKTIADSFEAELRL